MEDCKLCSGSGCVVCRGKEHINNEPDKNKKDCEIATKIKYTKTEIKNLPGYETENECKSMVNFLNDQCLINHLCPQLRQMCDKTCYSFRAASVKPEADGYYYVGGFKCTNKIVNG